VLFPAVLASVDVDFLPEGIAGVLPRHPTCLEKRMGSQFLWRLPVFTDTMTEAVAHSL
jgi:hypothetical protein